MSYLEKLPKVESHTFHQPYGHIVKPANRITERTNREFITTYRDYEYDDKGNRKVVLRSIEEKV